MNDELKRRPLELRDFDAVVAEVRRLEASGYEMTGKWNLGQICWHLEGDLRSSMEGYPRWMYLFAPLRPLIRFVLLPRLLSFRTPRGMKSPSKFVPPRDVSDEPQAKTYVEQIERFRSFESDYWTHPGFGYNDRENLERVYAAHAAHHLSFLLPKSN